MIIQSLKMAVKSIMDNKLRSFLTMLGIIIGVVSLVVLVSLVSGATGSISESISSLGSNKLTVMISNDYGNPIKLGDLKEFLSECDSIEEVAASATSSVTASSSLDEVSVSVTGTTAAYKDIQGIEVDAGRFIMTPDVDNHSNVIVVNADLATDLLGRSRGVTGETISLNGSKYSIIGVIGEDSTSSSDETSSYEAYIPYTSMVRLTSSVSMNVTNFSVSVKDDDTDTAEEELESLLLKRFYDDDDAFNIINMNSIAEAMESVTNTLALLLGGIAGISLLVGGIGIMNIMLVSVTERTREIGIRKAIGARTGMIMLQFLIEALMVSLIGCLIGLALSWVGIQIVNIVGDVSYGVEPTIAILSICFSMTIGVLFGLYPARKAAKMKPIDALRFS